jgi:hypothetical protein
MSQKPIPVEEAAKGWFKSPAFVAEYDALEEEFAVAAALIQIRGVADVKRTDVAQPTEGRES